MSPSQSGVLSAAVVLPTVASIAVLLRFYVRRSKTMVGGDDWMILAGLGLTWAMSVILIVGAAIGSFGTTIPVDPKTGEEIYTPASLTATINSIKVWRSRSTSNSISIKLSVLLFYRRIFVGRKFTIYSLTICAFVALWCFAFFFATVFQCGGHPANWWTSQYTSEHLCSKTGKLELGFAVSDVMLDLVILTIPLPLIWNLKMSTSHKVAITGIFLLGLLSTAGALARMVVHVLSIYTTTINSRDILGDQTNIVVWSLVEAGVAIVAACLPTLRTLIGDHSTEGILRSIRSIFSLSSTRSHAQHRHGSHDIALTDSNEHEHPMDRNRSTETEHTSEIIESKSGG
ncbi:hypothetical protein MMC14_006712 [Varicellaria rhodocarpa]|nr:hypothetical protein [Varicellaria rhodocarpa]